ncbi:MAG: hypothetical protein RL339_1049 [Pseudomonadota bacterium]
MTSLSPQSGSATAARGVAFHHAVRHLAAGQERRAATRSPGRPVEAATMLLSAASRMRALIGPSTWLNLDLVAPDMALRRADSAAFEQILITAIGCLGRNGQPPRNVTIRVRKLGRKALVLIAHDGSPARLLHPGSHFAPLVRLAIAELRPIRFRHLGKLEVIAVTAGLSAAKPAAAGQRHRKNKEVDNEDRQPVAA